VVELLVDGIEAFCRDLEAAREVYQQRLAALRTYYASENPTAEQGFCSCRIRHNLRKGELLSRQLQRLTCSAASANDKIEDDHKK
jgi:hypothetical protein